MILMSHMKQAYQQYIGSPLKCSLLNTSLTPINSEPHGQRLVSTVNSFISIKRSDSTYYTFYVTQAYIKIYRNDLLKISQMFMRCRLQGVGRLYADIFAERTKCKIASITYPTVCLESFQAEIVCNHIYMLVVFLCGFTMKENITHNLVYNFPLYHYYCQ